MCSLEQSAMGVDEEGGKFWHQDDSDSERLLQAPLVLQGGSATLQLYLMYSMRLSGAERFFAGIYMLRQIFACSSKVLLS